MNCNLNYLSTISDGSNFFLKNHVFLSLTAQQKKIALIVSAAFAFLAICYVVKHSAWHYTNLLHGEYYKWAYKPPKCFMNLGEEEKLEMSKMLKKAGKNLRQLFLIAYDLKDEELKQYLGACPNLEKLILYYCNFTKNSIEKLPSTLKSLNLTGSKITDDLVKYLPKDLEELNLSRCTNLTDAAIKDLPPHLKELNLSYCSGITVSAIKDLPPSIKRLNFSHCYNLTINPMLDKFPYLESLDLSYCFNLTDAFMTALPITLRSLDLSYCLKLTDDSIKALPDHLISLKLSHCINFTDAVLQHLPSSLCCLYLTQCTQLSLNAINDLKNSHKKLMPVIKDF